jgi:hypothetical protein
MKEIPLTRNQVAIVDDSDYEVISSHKWLASYHTNGFYAARDITEPGNWRKSIRIYMHRELLGFPSGFDTDHINGNPLDNRRCNLRVVSHRSNTQNLHVSKSSRYVGVYAASNCNSWVARIRYKGKKRYICSTSVEEDAATAYRIASLVLSGCDVQCQN